MTAKKAALVQDVRAVGAREHDDAVGGPEAVHLHKELVERVLALVVAAGEAAAAAGAACGGGGCVACVRRQRGGGLCRV